jgi:hypothetical protein
VRFNPGDELVPLEGLEQLVFIVIGVIFLSVVVVLLSVVVVAVPIVARNLAGRHEHINTKRLRLLTAPSLAAKASRSSFSCSSAAYLR